jgi:hypothetical protein
MSEPAKDEAELMERVAEALYDNYDLDLPMSFTLAAIHAAGWAVVPVEPTEKMLDAAERAFPVESFDFYSMCRVEWAAMLAAAPGVKP